MYRNSAGSSNMGRGRGRGNNSRSNEMPPPHRNYTHATHQDQQYSRHQSTLPSPPRGRGRGVDKNRPAWLNNHSIAENLRENVHDKGKNDIANEDNTPNNTVEQSQVKHEVKIEIDEKEEIDTQIDKDEEIINQLAASNENDEDVMSFIKSKEEQEEDEARKLRLKRLKRKQNILDKYKDDDTSTTAVSNVVEQPPVQKQKMNESKQTIESKITSLSKSKNDKEKKQKDEDEFDMFSDDISSILSNNTKSNSKIIKSIGATDEDYDDAEGYYKGTISEIIPISNDNYKVLGIIGKGVFSTVYKCSSENNTITAMKIIRNNETMAKAAQVEFQILQKLQSTEENHIVNILHRTNPYEYRNHTIFIFEYMPYNLRQILQKFGSNVGLNIVALQRYGYQLFIALMHLRNQGIIHADIKPDNILVSEDYSTLKICDFGSAMNIDDCATSTSNSSTSSSNLTEAKMVITTTPYLISRFYRPPEVILGLPYNTLIDLWSLGVTLAELYTGKILFNGTTNNDMILKMIQIIGPISQKMIKKHVSAYTTYLQKTPFFNVENGDFWKIDVDDIQRKPCIKIISNVDLMKPKQTLMDIFMAMHYKQQQSQVNNMNYKERMLLRLFVDLLSKCLILDPLRRIHVDEALVHEFFTYGTTTTSDDGKNGNSATSNAKSI